MIKLKTIDGEIVIKPTIFPDGTSQIWKLPENMLKRKEFLITWNFEAEREIIDLCSLVSLLPLVKDAHIHLHMPYLPYGRQDKEVNNNQTFNLYVLAQMIKACNFNKITTVDAHNPERFALLFKNSENISPYSIHEKVIMDYKPECIIFPDHGAKERYGKSLSHVRSLYADKVRNNLTGEIVGHTIHIPSGECFIERAKFLIIDDICDGGATFISVAKALRKELMNDYIQVGLFVTHGIFSKGIQHLIDNGINEVITTNSLAKNYGLGYPV